MNSSVEGMLFDVQQRGEDILLWIRDDEAFVHPIIDRLRPTIFAAGPPLLVDKLSRRLQILGVLAEAPSTVERTHFYSNRMVRVTQYVLSKPSFLRTIHRKLYALFERIEIYHSDIETPTLYLFEKRLIPTGRVRARCRPAPSSSIPLLETIEPLEDSDAFDFEIPALRFSRISLTGSHRLGLKAPNLLRLECKKCRECNGTLVELSPENPAELIPGVNEFLDRHDPDVVLSEYGDRAIFPALFRLSRDMNLPLHFDRIATKRRIITEGRSYFTYGSMIFRAASYPLHGRWHIDAHNSFVHRESGLDGVIQLARMSRIPVQRMARVSTGAAMTSIQTGIALHLNYLVPWQKSHSEQPRTALELLESDKGGLVFEPEIRDGAAFEQVAQIDFSQMYPTIMTRHNLSPETVLCSCCRREEVASGSCDGESGAMAGGRGRPVWVDCDLVPEANFPICRRRRGIVPLSLAPILELRRYLKQRKKTAPTPEERRRASERQDALKWLLVTCFGYLGYRNAKFGRLESHESVTAFGRRKLLRAKEISEDAGFHVLHAITDCLFLFRERGFTPDELSGLCDRISHDVDVEMSIEGVYSWIVFLSSRGDERLPVANRYFGRFVDGSLKIRGIQARRRDTPPWIREAQEAFLNIMSQAPDLKSLRERHGEMNALYRKKEGDLMGRHVPWRELLLRRTVSRSLEEYEAAGASALSLEQLAEEGVHLQPGEKVRYLIRSKGDRDRRQRYLTEERATREELSGAIPLYDAGAYAGLLREAFREVWGAFAPPGYFRMLGDGQLRLPYQR